MKIQTDKWLGVKGLTIKHKQYSLAIFCNALMTYRLRNQEKFKIPSTDLVFSIKRNRRKALLIWDTDITILGFTFQFQKYKPEII
jgi:hypothetical protein